VIFATHNCGSFGEIEARFEAIPKTQTVFLTVNLGFKERVEPRNTALEDGNRPEAK